MTGDDQPLFAIGHDQMPALSGDAITELFKHSLGVALTDAGDFGHRF